MSLKHLFDSIAAAGHYEDLGPYSSALKDNEIDVSDLPMPRILGEGEEEPILVWTANVWEDCKFYPNRWPAGDWVMSYTSREAAILDPDFAGDLPYRTTLDERLVYAKETDCLGVVLIDESYTVIETWRV